MNAHEAQMSQRVYSKSSSATPSLKQLIVEAREAFGGFWPRAEPWLGHSEIPAERKLLLPTITFVSSEFGQLNYAGYWKICMKIYSDQLYKKKGLPPIEEQADKLKKFKQMAYTALGIKKCVPRAELTPEQLKSREDAYAKKQDKRKRDREAVDAGTATVEQQNAREVVLRNHRDFHDLEAMLRSMRDIDPEAYAEVPDYYKNGLHAQEQFNHYRAGRTQERVQDRLQELATRDMPFRPYSDSEFAALKVELTAKVDPIFKADRMPYIGTTKHDGEAFDNEVSRWVREQLTITRRDGVPIKTRRDLEDLGFQVDVLHESSFMFNCRVLETHLHATFHSDNRRLWQKIGVGSYSLSDEAIQDQLKYARISKVFVVHAPMSVRDKLHFCANVPLFSRQ